MSKVAAKELKRLIAAGAPQSPDSSVMIRDKIQRMQSLSEADRHLIDLIQEKVSDQRRAFAERQKTVRDLVDRFRQLEQMARNETDHISLLQTQIQSQAEEIDRIRAEKNSLVSLNESLREEASAKREAYSAAIQRNQSCEVQIQKSNSQVEQLNIEAQNLRNKLNQHERISEQFEEKSKVLEMEKQKLGEEIKLVRQELELSLEREKTTSSENVKMRSQLQFEERNLKSLHKQDSEHFQQQVISAHERIKQLEQENHRKAEQIESLARQVETTKSEKSLEAQQYCKTIDSILERLSDNEQKLQDKKDKNIVLSLHLQSVLSAFEKITSEFQNLQGINKLLCQQVIVRDKDIQKLTHKTSQIQQASYSATSTFNASSDHFEIKQHNSSSELRKSCERLAQALAKIKSLQLQCQQNRQALVQARADIQANQAAVSMAVASEAAATERLTRMTEMEHELGQAIMQLLNACEAMEGSFTCFTCMSLYQYPVTCVPCGHIVCADCVKRGPCPECQAPIKDSLTNPSLHVLAGKFTYITIVLGKLRQRLHYSGLSPM